MIALPQKHNPFREPGWRARRARALVYDPAGPQRLHRQLDDEYIRDFYKFLLASKTSETMPDREARTIKLMRAMPGIYYANQFSMHPDEEWRAILDAKILAGEPDDLIAQDLNTLPETVKYYEALFYNVRDRLHAKTYITKTVLGPAMLRDAASQSGGASSAVRHTCYRLFGYYGGPVVLDMMLSGLSSEGIPDAEEKVEAWLDKAIQSTLRQRTAFAAHGFEINKFNVMQLFEIQQRFIQMHEEFQRTAGGDKANYLSNVEALLDRINISTGAKSRDYLTQTSAEFEQTAIEPRVVEQYALARGEVPRSLTDKLTSSPQPKKISYEPNTDQAS